MKILVSVATRLEVNLGSIQSKVPPKALFELNGAIYLVDRNKFLKSPTIIGENTQFFEMPWAFHDIDYPFDWKCARRF